MGGLNGWRKIEAFFERFRRDPDLDALREQGSVIESAVEECFVYARRRGLDAQEQRALAQKARLYAFLASRHDHHHLDEQALDYYEEAIQISERPEPFVTWSLRKANLLRRLNRDDEELEELEGLPMSVDTRLVIANLHSCPFLLTRPVH
jgi:hypothetical protein